MSIDDKCARVVCNVLHDGTRCYSYPGAKVRVITREARYYAKTRAFASFYALFRENARDLRVIPPQFSEISRTFATG